MTTWSRDKQLPMLAFAVVFAAALAPLLFTKHGLQIAPIWPANGLALVLATRSRKNELPRLQFCAAFAAATFLANLAGGNSLALSAAFTVGNFAEIVAAYAVIHWQGWRRSSDHEPTGAHTVLMRTVAAAVAGPAIGATLGAAGLMQILGQGFWSLWLGWFFSSALSMLLVVSIGLGWPARFNAREVNGRALGALLAAAVVATAAVAPAFVSGRIALLILTAPVIMLAAVILRASGVGITLAIVAVCSLTLAGDEEVASRFNAIFAADELVLLIQVYLVVQGVIALALAAILDERDAFRASLKAQREFAEKQAGLRLQLLTSIAHDIRTPLNVVQGCSELMDKSGALTQAQKDLLGATQRAATQLQELAVNLLDTSRIESGLMAFEPEPIEPPALLVEVAEFAKAGLGNPAAQVSIDCPAGVRIWADRLRLRQICSNLITNAIRHGAEYGEVLVRVHANREACVVAIEDRGPGFRPDFVIGSGLTTAPANSKNAGVGLTLVKQMVGAHGGSMSISSTPFVSTCVTVTFPAQGTSAALKAIQLSHEVATAA